ncbi:MAG: leucine-rich repeat domain-containing protein [Bacilli bacterium]|nr:leucine-rich repeat domain-containing protein [Bacilli bacterium]
MLKKLFARAASLGLALVALCGCKELHVHDLDVPFEYSDTEHWKTCSSCGEKFIVSEHILNDINDKCLVCDYVDPIAIVDENGVLTGLTPHGKRKKIIDLPSNVLYVSKDGLADSSVVLLNLSKEFIGYYAGAFDKPNLIVKPAEENVTWELVDGIYYKHDILSEYDARIDETYYKSLDEAFASVTSDETTITVLKDDLTLKEDVFINHIVTLEAYHSHIKLNCNFNINAGGILNVPSSINLTSNVKLMLANTREEIEDYYEDVYSSGAIAFVGTETKPENVYVEYVKSFDEVVGLGYEAVGSKQIVNSLLVLPVKHYAYGTFVFSKDFKNIKGLTYYGQAVSDLYVTNVVHGINAVIAPYAFAVYTDIKINIHKISDTHITLYRTKGQFTSLHICDGITAIGEGAFTNKTTSDIFHEVKLQIKILLSRISSVEIGDSVTNIGYRAFEQQLCIEEVRGGRGLTNIDRYAFSENVSLRIVDFSEAYKLTQIERNVFEYCDSLVSICLPPVGWSIDGNTYFPDQFDPEAVAYCLVYSNSGDRLVRTSVGHFAYTASTSKDYTGRYNKVAFTNDLASAINGVADSGWVYLLEDTPLEQRNININNVNKAMSIFADPSLGDVTIGSADQDLTVNSNAFLTLSNITPLSRSIILKNSSTSDNAVVKTGGFAIRTTNGEPTPELDVKYDCKNAEKSIATKTRVNLIRNEYYDAYGLLDFEDVDDTQIIKNVSRLGSLANELDIKEQYDISSSSIDLNLEIAENAFKGNTSLRRVSIDRKIEYIRNSAFNGCTNLREVKIGYECTLMITRLKEIGENAFRGCSNLAFFGINDKNISTSFNVIGADAFNGCAYLETADLGMAKYSDWKITGLFDGTISHIVLMDVKLAPVWLRSLTGSRWDRIISE